MITADRFGEFFQALNGCPPFPWQERLVRRVARGGETTWPEAMAMPTASGKTACIDVAVFALACQAEWGAKRTAPRRIFFVVDRRVVVDAAYKRAEGIAEKLREAHDGILGEVAAALRTLAGGDDPLACFELRGGIYRDDAWARTPTQPTIIASTVDQIGSRLLFRGYGLRSGSLWPVHAGLAANDSLILLDEAHCSEPFRQTLQAIARYRTWAEEPLNLPFAFSMLSATPGRQAADLFAPDHEDFSHPILRKRFDASKPARLVIAEKAKGKRGSEALAKELSERAKVFLSDGPRAVAVIVNRVATAKLVHEQVAAFKECDVVLMTGRMRPWDRDRLAEGLKTLMSRDSDSVLPRSMVVVATQCLEVGADLDFDDMVTECASLDALRQRFGRLNRGGRDIAPRAAVVIRDDQRSDSSEDPVYGAALSNTWRWLEKHATEGVIDFGINTLGALLSSASEARLTALYPDAPVMLPAHVDCWVQTSPEPRPTPDVSVFLHGPQRESADVQVCWRADLNPESADPKWIEAVALCPPVAKECMPVPIHAFRRWMRGEKTDVADVDAAMSATEEDEPPSLRRVLRWLGPAASECVKDPDAIRPGDTVVLPVAAGGWDAFGHLPGGTGEADVAEQGQWETHGKAVLRLFPGRCAEWPEADSWQTLLDAEELHVSEYRAALRELSPSVPPWLAEIAKHLARDGRCSVQQHPEGGLVFTASRRINPSGGFTDEDDTSSCGVRVTLGVHLGGVESLAKRYAKCCGLTAGLTSDIVLAAECHDLGKIDPRFQAMLNNGRSVVFGELLAKSDALDSRLRRQARVLSRYPAEGRHELLSVRLVENSEALRAKANDLDLVLHLIGSHHGRCRPFAPVVKDEQPLEVHYSHRGEILTANSATGLERLDSGASQRFWRLVRRYGWWGLAFIEAIVRLADHRCSEMEQMRVEAGVDAEKEAA